MGESVISINSDIQSENTKVYEKSLSTVTGISYNGKNKKSTNIMSATSRLKYGWRNFFSNIFAAKPSISKIRLPRNVSKQKISLESKHSNSDKIVDEVKRVPKKTHVQKSIEPPITSSVEENIYLKNIKDDLALAIVLPLDIKGKYVNVAIELEALSTGQEESLYEKGLHFFEETCIRSVFIGIIKVPLHVNLECIANMPIYFVDSTKSSESDFNNKIERAVRPMNNELPIDIDKYALVEAIYIKIKLNHLQPKNIIKTSYDPLPYHFFGRDTQVVNYESNHHESAETAKDITAMLNNISAYQASCKKTKDGAHPTEFPFANNQIPPNQNPALNVIPQEPKNKKPIMSYDAAKIVDNIIKPDDNSMNEYDERSRAIVKEILSHVMNRVQVQDISTQYSKIITNVNKEIDVQKSLLIKNNASCDANVQKEKKLQFLSDIFEKDEALSPPNAPPAKRSLDTVYPKSSTSCISSSTYVTASATESDASMCFLKVPNNTPMAQVPRYVLRYDSSIALPTLEKQPRKDEMRPVKMLHQTQKHHQLFENDFNINYMTLPPQATHISKSKKHKDRNRVEDSRKRLNENARAEIDRTLDLLETARVKLVTYLKRSNYSESDVSEKNNYLDCTTDTEAGSACQLIALDSTIHRHSTSIKPMSKEHRRHQKTYLSRDIKLKDPKPTHSVDEYRKVIISDATGKKQFFLDEGKTEKIQEVIGPAVAPPEIFITTGPDETPLPNTTQNVYASVEENAVERTPSQQTQDLLLKERYFSENTINNELSYTIVENDINIMIQDLLSESYTIKELAYANDIPIDTYEEPLVTIEETTPNAVQAILKDVVQTSVEESEETKLHEDVAYIMEFILRRTEQALDSKLMLGKSVTSTPIHVNYCLINERMKEDTTKAVGDTKWDPCDIDDYNTTDVPEKLFFSNTNSDNDVNARTNKTPVTSWNFGETSCIDEPIIHVRNICLSKEGDLVYSKEKLIDSLERGTAFLTHIYDEICQDSTVFDELSKDKENSSKQNILEYDQYAEAVKLCTPSDECIDTKITTCISSTDVLMTNCNNDDTDTSKANIEETPENIEQTTPDVQVDAVQPVNACVLRTSKKLDPFPNNVSGGATPNSDEEVLLGITAITDFGKENIFAPLMSTIDPTSDCSVAESTKTSVPEDTSTTSKQVEVLKTPTHLISNSNSEILGAEQTLNTKNIIIKSRGRFDCTATTSTEGECTASCMSSVSLNDDSDSDDGDTYTFVFPQLKEEYISVQELNNEQEIYDINENIERNDELCKHDTFHNQNSANSLNESFILYDYSDGSAKSDSVDTNNTIPSLAGTEFNNNDGEYTINKTSERIHKI